MATPRPTSSADGPCACTAVRKASRAISRHYEAHLAPTGTTATQFSILRCLEREGPLTLSRLADDLVMERTSVYRAIAPLEAEELVKIDPSPDDARARIARLTAGGRARIRKVLPHWRRAQAAFVETLGRDHWVHLADDLAAAVTLLRERTHD